MLTFLMFLRHTPDMCALWNEQSAKIYAECGNKLAEFEAKHGVKMVGFWNVPSEHLTVQVFEAPTFEAFQALSMEPEIVNMSNVDTIEIKQAITFEEAMQMMQMMQQKK
jgi:hypothetical protein